MSGKGSHARLPKELGLLDVYAISTGAMFSSGFFLLPGLAAAQTGPSVALAYLVAGFFILPAMFSVAELSTAMPRAGGAYYFLDRAMGPLVGTVGGLGTWIGLVFKSAFALVGMGAYLSIYLDVSVPALAVVLTAAFGLLNVVGAKETSRLQRVLVGALVVILAVFVVQGLFEVASPARRGTLEARFSDFFAFGAAGFLSTVGFVFVSYAGLTKVASVAEEIRDPDRNIPLGMALSLVTASVIYSVGVFIMVAVLPPEALRQDLTPVATAAGEFFDWLPGGLGVILIVVAAIAAFASTGNAGILSASRYPLAMARDRLVPQAFAGLGRFRTPTLAIATTAGLMALAILTLDIAAIAKLASAFQLLLFSLLNLAVVIMRESEIEGYDPGFRSPLYPGMQVFGFLAPLWLIAEMGQVAILFTFGLVALTTAWYFYYARSRVGRSGAIFHTFARLGELRHLDLDLELRDIAKERGLRDSDPYDEVVARAPVIDVQEPLSSDVLVRGVLAELARVTDASAGIAQGIDEAIEAGFVPMDRRMALMHWRVDGLSRTTLVLVRSGAGLTGRFGGMEKGALSALRGVIVVVSPQGEPGRHLRLLGHLAGKMEQPTFAAAWGEAESEAALRATLLREERSLTLRVASDPITASWVGRPLHTIGLPPDTLIGLVLRGNEEIVPSGSTTLAGGDHITVIGSPEGIERLRTRVRGGIERDVLEVAAAP